MLQKKKTIDTIVAIALLVAGFLTFISLFGSIADSRVGSVTLDGMNVFTLLRDGPKTISTGFNKNSDYSQLSQAIITLLCIIFYFSGLICFLVFGGLGALNLLRFLQGKEELKTNYVLRAVILKTTFDLFSFFLSYGVITNISSGASMGNFLGWGSILAIVSSFIVVMAYSFRYIYMAYLLKKNIYIPVMMSIGVLLIMIASIVGCHNQLQVADLNSGLSTKVNGLELTITIMAINAKGYTLSGEASTCEFGGILMMSAPLLIISAIDFFKIAKKKRDFAMILDGALPIVITIIGLIMVTSTSTEAGFSSFQAGAGLITSLVLLGIASILFIVCFVIYKNKNITLRPEELVEEMTNYKEETSSNSESSDETSEEETKEDNINATL